MKITHSQFQTILNNAPAGIDKSKLTEKFIMEGHDIEGIDSNQVRQKLQPVKQEGSLWDITKSVLKGETSFPVKETDTNPAVLLAKKFGNIPSSAAGITRGSIAPVNPLDTNSSLNIGSNIVKSAEALGDIYGDDGAVEGTKAIFGGLVDTAKRIFKAPGEAYINYLESTGYADDPSAKKLFETSIVKPLEALAKMDIENPLLIPFLLYGNQKFKNLKGKSGNALDDVDAKLHQENIRTAEQMDNAALEKFAGSDLTKGKTTQEILDMNKNLAFPATESGQSTVPKITNNFTKQVITKSKESIGDIIDKTKTTLFGKEKPISNIDDVINQADKTLKPSEILTKTEQATAKPSLRERWAGIRPDIKNRIAGKQDKLKEYFDVAHARNNFDTLPTPFEHGADNVYKAVSNIEKQLNDVGSDIGKFRKKVSTYKAKPDSIVKIENSFNGEISKLNLEIKNGVIKQKAGTVKRVNSEAEIKALNELYGDLQTVKQSPNLERLIDLRNLFDSKINFAKSTREVSSSLDPLSRNIRKQIADVSAEIVGKSEAGNLTKYSEVIDALNDLKSFSDRKAGAEFLLKQVLSEKGGTARKTIQTIKEITGIDLMDDAVMASIATDLIGNAAQKGVLRQEMIKAGLDVSAILKGDPKGAIDLMFKLGKKSLVNEEKQFLKAAR